MLDDVALKNVRLTGAADGAGEEATVHYNIHLFGEILCEICLLKSI